MATAAKATMFAGLAALTLASGCWGTRSDEPPIHIWHNMDFQQKFEAQEVNEFFADGRAMRPPVEGAVAWGRDAEAPNPDFLKDDDHYYRGKRGGKYADGLPKQLKMGDDLVHRGEQRYNIYCAPCHDETGRGKGPVTRRGGGFKVPPASLHQDKLRPMKLGYFYDVITNGKGTMQPYAAQIPVADRWAIAVWVRTLQRFGAEQKWDDTPKAPAAGAEKGAK